MIIYNNVRSFEILGISINFRDKTALEIDISLKKEQKTNIHLNDLDTTDNTVTYININ